MLEMLTVNGSRKEAPSSFCLRHTRDCVKSRRRCGAWGRKGTLSYFVFLFLWIPVRTLSFPSGLSDAPSCWEREKAFRCALMASSSFRSSRVHAVNGAAVIYERHRVACASAAAAAATAIPLVLQPLSGLRLSVRGCPDMPPLPPLFFFLFCVSPSWSVR